MKTLKPLLGLMLFFLLLPQAARAANAPSGIDTLRPYFDSQTLAVGHFDTSKIDFAAIDQFLRDVFASAKVPDSDPLVAEIQPAIAAAKGVLAQFKKLGGRHVYWVVSHMELWPNMKPGAVLIPLEAGGDVKGMADFLRGLIQEKDITVAPLANDLIFLGDEETLTRMQAMKAEPRPDVEAALGAAPASALQVVVVPTADERRGVEELMPRLPEEIGGGPADSLARGLKSLTVSVDLPPALAATLRVEGESADVSRQVADLLSRGIAAVSGALPPAGNDPLVPAIGRFLDELKPQVDGSAVVIKLTADQVREFYPAMAQAFMRERAVAEHQRDAVKLRAIAQACIIWASAHQGAMPDHLGRLLLDNMITPAILVMSSSRTKPLELTPEMRKQAKADFAAFAKEVDAHCDAVYLGKGMKEATDSAVVLAYERPERHSNDEIITMVFTDGHSEAVRLNDVAGVLRDTNEYRKKLNLPEVDTEAIMKAAGQ